MAPATRSSLASERTEYSVQPMHRFYFWWNSGYWGDTFFDAMFPINAYKKLSGKLDLNDPTDPYGGWWWVPLESASSYHPGGANFAFVDGSVHFIKESIATWPSDPKNSGEAVGIAYGQFGEHLWGTVHSTRLSGARDSQCRRGDQQRFVLRLIAPRRIVPPRRVQLRPNAVHRASTNRPRSHMSSQLSVVR